MASFEIDIKPGADGSWDDPRNISVRGDNICFTELIRSGESVKDEYLQAPPIQLAFWVVDNWWRLRWEPIISNRIDPNWRLAHELSAIGGGYFWPRLQIWGEDTRVGLACRSDSPSMNYSLRFTTDALVYVDADQFESSVDQFLEVSVNENSIDKEALRAQYFALKGEREDEDATSWRRLEAKLGYDVDNAPDGLIPGLLGFVKSFGQAGVEEAAAASQGEGATELLKKEINVAEKSRVVFEMNDAVQAAGGIQQLSSKPIWEIAEDAATRVREGLCADAGPLRNARLSELLGTSKNHFRSSDSKASRLAYGLRLREGDSGKNVVALNAIRPQGRRFQMCRILGDAIWSSNDALGPITSTKTVRQQFQRAFAQSLLCPHKDLLAYINTDEPSEEDVSAAASHFHVSERVVQTLLVNKGKIGRHQFEDMVEAA